jgi:uncharacterized protein YdeI (YjbR/CyaY-like superfamily)
VKPTFFKTAREFERWLATHHRKESLLLVGFHTVASGKPCMRFPEALDAALAYGWIDGLRHRVAPDVYTVRFTPVWRPSSGVTRTGRGTTMPRATNPHLTPRRCAH